MALSPPPKQKKTDGASLAQCKEAALTWEIVEFVLQRLRIEELRAAFQDLGPRGQLCLLQVLRAQEGRGGLPLCLQQEPCEFVSDLLFGAADHAKLLALAQLEPLLEDQLPGGIAWLEAWDARSLS